MASTGVIAVAGLSLPPKNRSQPRQLETTQAVRQFHLKLSGEQAANLAVNVPLHAVENVADDAFDPVDGGAIVHNAAIQQQSGYDA